MRELQRKREEARELLLFVEEVVHFQLRRGRAVVVENPKRSLLWEQMPMLSAMGSPGVAAVTVDMCAYNKRRPDTKELVKKPTTFKGAATACTETSDLRWTS